MNVLNGKNTNFHIHTRIINIKYYDLIISQNKTSSTSSNPNITYNWSNGASTQSISIPDGGPYQVTASLGGCSISKQVDIPKNPEDYLWIYPSGCYTDCIKNSDELYNHLIGPTLSLNTWSWNDYGSPIQSGTTSF